MKTLTVFSLFLGLSLFFTEKAMALSHRGYWIPQTKTLEYGEIKYDLGTYNAIDKAANSDHESVVGLSAGILRIYSWRMDIGIDWWEPTPDQLMKALATHARISFQDFEKDGWSIAIGGDRFALGADYWDYNLLYFAFQNRVGARLMAEMGAYSGNEPRIGNANGAFAGIWYRIQNGHGDIGVEWMSGNGPLGAIAPGIRAELRDGVEGLLSIVIAQKRPEQRDLLQARLTVYF